MREGTSCRDALHKKSNCIKAYLCLLKWSSYFTETVMFKLMMKEMWLLPDLPRSHSPATLPSGPPTLCEISTQEMDR